jgi:UDP-N-acetylglucosamine diphosphorylase/glucosamine-1-phosphate N-acetyltransferase
MKKIVFTEEFCQPENLYPFTLTRQVQDIRIGVFTIREKWEMALGVSSLDKHEGDYKDLDRAIKIEEQIGDDLIYLVHGTILPTTSLIKKIKKMKHGDFISLPGRESIVYCISKEEVIGHNKIKVNHAVEIKDGFREIKFPWDLLKVNAWAIQEDIDLMMKSIKLQKISSSNKLIQSDKIFIEKGASVEHCYLNATDGPIYIAKSATVMEGSMIRGPVAICEGATIKMGAKIYGATTIGPYCIAGGEIKNSILFSNSNKAHDGYLGDSVIGEWCNLGAGTSNSNIKNNASDVMVWTPYGQVNAGKKFGALIGDYSRTAINTSINTGTVIGSCSNVFGQGLTPKYIPSFSWGSDGVERYKFEKALEDINNWMGLKHKQISDSEKFILKHIFDHH